MLVATDGFYRHVPLDRLPALIEEVTGQGVDAVRGRLIKEMLAGGGGRDDFSLAVVAVDGPGAAGSSGPGGGVAEHPLTDAQRDEAAQALRADADLMMPLEEVSLVMPRAPPGVVRV